MQTRPSHFYALIFAFMLPWSGQAFAAEPAGAASVELPPAADVDIDFDTHIRPILQTHCVRCHGPEKQRAGLRLDNRRDGLTGGDSGPVVKAQDPAGSRLMQLVAGQDPDMRMPFQSKPLSTQQIALLRAWIEQGADWPAGDEPAARRTSDHWSFQPVQRPPLPNINDIAWPRNAIDRFTLARMEAAGLAPSPPADRATLIRRLYLDLLGLTPPPAEVDAFLNDNQPGAYERVVDRLLASPHYGERWGRHWLDQARYADSHGYSIDGDRTMWPYRDWVIAALNADMPFDRFTVEQLAGDLLEKGQGQRAEGQGARHSEPATHAESLGSWPSALGPLVATGFHRNTLINQEGGSDPEQFRAEATVDRVNTTGAVWLGLTVGCAQCHTHKYDPITQREYYELYAFFNNAADRNGAGPTVRLQTRADEARLAKLRDAVTEAEQALRAHDASAAAAQREWEKMIASVDEPVRWHTAAPATYESAKGAELTKLEDGSILAGGENKPHDTYIVEQPAGDGVERITAVRLELIPHESLPNKGPGRAGNGNIVLSGFELAIDGKPAKFVRAIASHEQSGYPAAHAIDGDKGTGWAINGGGEANPINGPHHAIFILNEPLAVSPTQTLRFTLKHERPDNPSYQVGRFRITATDAHPAALSAKAPADLADAASIPPDARTDAQKKLLAEAFRKTDTQRAGFVKAVEAAKKRAQDFERSLPNIMVMRDLDNPRETYVHIRGDFLRHGDRVEPDTPEVLPALNGAGSGATAASAVRRGPQSTAGTAVAQDAVASPPDRLDLARWLVSDDNPLTPRVTVNRIWMHYFGRGLVETENDFGTQGTPPTHPMLLDWLADTFRGEHAGPAWSMKKMHRLIVTSTTYRQSSRLTSELLSRDPRNDLLARQSRFRVEAEIVRDLALAASGMLTPEIGGPSVRPPQPEGVYDFTQNKKSWRADTGPDRYRRGMYTFFYRSAPYPMLTTFDTPNFNTTCTARVRSNTPLQSLTLANNDAFFELAQGLAARVLREEPSSDEARMTRAFRLCLGREPAAEEHSRLMQYLRLQVQRFESDADAAKKVAPSNVTEGVSAAEAAAWTAVARALMNLDEFITRE